MTPLCQLAEKYVTDKYSVHRYTPIYYDLFKDRIGTVRTILEIGIGRGKGTLRKHAASLKMWEEFFPLAEVIGVDHDRKIMINEGRIRSVYGDQSLEQTMREVALNASPIDIVIDDGSHQPAHQVSSARMMLPFVMVGGFYIIEDIRSEVVFSELSRQFKCERIHTNKAVATSLLCVIRC